MVDPKSNSIVTTGIIAFILFIGATIIEVMITIWAFKKFGGCPMREDC